MEDVSLWINVNVGLLSVIVGFLAINAAAAFMVARNSDAETTDLIGLQAIEIVESE